jgi:hypothetical protein
MPDGTQHVRLFWQPSPDAEMIEYDLETQQSHLKNYIVVTSRAKTSKPDERARKVTLLYEFGHQSDG